MRGSRRGRGRVYRSVERQNRRHAGLIAPSINSHIRPGGRLAEIIARVPSGARVLDVGTDHGYVPVALALQGFAQVYASDAAERPLSVAKRNAVEYGVAERIGFILADGVPDSLRGEIDCVIIAGMGGETIADIIRRAMWLRGDGTLLILQPQTKIAVLREFLFANGFAVPNAVTARDGKRSYTIFTARGNEELQ